MLNTKEVQKILKAKNLKKEAMEIVVHNLTEFISIVVHNMPKSLDAGKGAAAGTLTHKIIEQNELVKRMIERNGMVQQNELVKNIIEQNELVKFMIKRNSMVQQNELASDIIEQNELAKKVIDEKQVSKALGKVGMGKDAIKIVVHNLNELVSIVVHNLPKV
jgi:hypothetical protein